MLIVRGGVRPNCKQMWKCWPVFSIEILFFDTQNTFSLIARGLENAVLMPLLYRRLFLIVQQQAVRKNWGFLQLEENDFFLVWNPFQNTYNRILRSIAYKKIRKSKGSGGGGVVNPYGRPDWKNTNFLRLLKEIIRPQTKLFRNHCAEIVKSAWETSNW